MNTLCKSKYPSSHRLLLMAGMIVILLLTVYMFTGSRLMFHSDSASAVTLSMEMIRTGSIWPESWFGSTGIYITHYPIWLALHFVDDLMLAKSIGQMVWLGFFLIGIVLLSRKVLKNNSWICIVPLLCTYFSNVQYDMIFVQDAYVGTLCLMFYTASAYVVAIKSFTTWEWDYRKLLLFFIVLLATCSVGIILLQAVVVPILGASIWMYLQNNYKKTYGNIDISALRRLLAIIGGIVLTAIAGCLIYFYAAERTHLAGNPEMTTLVSSFQQIGDNLSLLIQSFFLIAGLCNDISIFSVNGILSIGRLAVFTMCTLILPVFAYKKYRVERPEIQFFFVFTVVHVLEVLVLLIVTDGGLDVDATGRYLLTSFILLQIVGIYYVYTYCLQSENLLSALTALVASVFAVASMFTVCKDIVGYKDQYAEMKGVSQFLLQHDLDYGYATFWNAGKNTVLSNGKVQINGVSVNRNQVSPYYWLTSKDWYESDYYQGDTFLLLTSNEMEEYAPSGLEDTVLGLPDEQLNYKDYTVLVYHYNIAENRFNGPLDDLKNYVPNSMTVSDPSMVQEDQTILIQPGQIMYGPYIDLGAGNYELTVTTELEETQKLKITADAGKEELLSADLKDGTTVIPFTLNSDKTQVEFVVENIKEIPARICEIRLKVRDI